MCRRDSLYLERILLAVALDQLVMDGGLKSRTTCSDDRWLLETAQCAGV